MPEQNYKPIKTFKRFEEAVVKLARTFDEDRKSRNLSLEDEKEMQNKVEALRIAYLKGTNDPIKKELRKQQVYIIRLWGNYFYLISDGKFLREKLEKAKNLKLKEIIKAEVVKQPRKLTISERAINYLFGQMKIKGVEGYKTRGRELDYKLMWIVDFLSDLMGSAFSKGKRGELVLFRNAAMFFKYMKNIEKYEPFVIDFKASEVRKWFGFNSDKMPVKEVVGLFKGLQEVIFEAHGEPILRDAEKKEWSRTTVSSSLYSLKKEKIGIISNRWKTKDYLLTLRFDSVMGWLFLQNLSCGKSARITLPKNAIHELSGYEQNILREMRLWKKPPPYPIQKLGNIAGFKAKEVTKLKNSLIKALTDLKEKRYIENFVYTGRGENMKFSINKLRFVSKAHEG